MSLVNMNLLQFTICHEEDKEFCLVGFLMLAYYGILSMKNSLIEIVLGIIFPVFLLFNYPNAVASFPTAHGLPQPLWLC